MIEINGVRHQLVEDDPIRGFCENCSLYDICLMKEINLCAILGNCDCHFEIETKNV